MELEDIIWIVIACLALCLAFIAILLVWLLRRPATRFRVAAELTASPSQEATSALYIAVTNLSDFPITICEVGITVATLGLEPSRKIPLDMASGNEYVRVEPLDQQRIEVSEDPDQPGDNILGVYARTACGKRSTNTQPQVRETIRKAWSA